MKPTAFLLPGLTLASAIAPRQIKTLCEQYGYWSGNGYEVLNNLWGKDSATSGSQCTYVDSASSSGVGIRSTWTWQGGQNNVKSYIYAGKQTARGRKISSFGSMQTSMQWSYNTNNIRANVAYDIFTAADPNHVNSSGDYELMIWLGKFGDVQPIGSSTGNVQVNGQTWNLWIGYNGSMKVFSFIAPQNLQNWSGDAKQFFNYLEKNQGYPASQQNLIVFQTGTEAFTGGPATFTVQRFSASI